LCASAIAATCGLLPAAAARTLDIYFIDVEGGQSTLVVTPAGASLLIDTGFPGDGTFASLPGDPKAARDANRILAAAHAAGVKQIDLLLITHFHADHDGGIVELAQLLPIRTFVDHGTVRPEAENVAGTLAAYDRYVAVRAKGRHLEPTPGDRLPLKGVDAVVVSAAGQTLTKALSGAGDANQKCGPVFPPEEPNENPRSTGVRLQYGRFRFLDVGDLTGAPLHALACPTNMVGPIDAYLVAHHGGPDASDPATFVAFRPRVAIVNNGAMKGGANELLAALHDVPNLEDAWQLHQSTRAGAQNVPDRRIANMDDSDGYWIKLSASEDGSFTVTNGRSGDVKAYAPSASASK
jgi:beta-lactamase superfamily II metal-dependent hydrolase